MRNMHEMLYAFRTQNQERTAIRRTSRGSDPGGGGVQFTDTPRPPPPPGSDPCPSWADHGTANEFCDTGSCGPTDTAAPERGAIPCGGPLGVGQILDRGGGHVPHMRAAGHARHIPSKRRDWHVPLPWALTGTTRGRHNNRPGRPAGPGPAPAATFHPILGPGKVAHHQIRR